MNDIIKPARTAEVQVSFGGVDITDQIKPYLISMTYIDAQDGEADDLQIELQDRDGTWLNDWLPELLDAAAGTRNDWTEDSDGTAEPDAPAEPEPTESVADPSGAGIYEVNSSIGLNVRSGPGTSYSKLGTASNGTSVEVDFITDHWAAVGYNGTTVYMCADYLTYVSPRSASGDSGSADDETELSNSGLRISAAIARKNWNTDDTNDVLDCGTFELDSISGDGPPSGITLKATAASFSSAIRQTKKSRSWENYYLSGIAAEIARKHGMSCMYEVSQDPYYERVEQYKTGDTEFLSGLCSSSGISMKISSGMLILFDQAAYEGRDTVQVITYGDGSYEKYKLSTGKADSEYSSCRVSYVAPTGECIEATAYVEDYDEEKETNQQLEISIPCYSTGEALWLAEKHLRLHNKFQRQATFTMPGNTGVAAGATVELAGFGLWNGKYIIEEARHSVSRKGYTTQIKMRAVLEGY